MIRTKAVTTVEKTKTRVTEDETEILHGTIVLKKLIIPWTSTNIIVCAEYYFTSIGVCEELHIFELYFISVLNITK